MVRNTHRELPTREQLRIWRGFVETSDVLRTRVGNSLLDQFGLSAGDYQVLLALSEATDYRLRSSELAALIGWERSRLSHHLGRMEKRDLITRTPCEHDPHGIDVTMTAAGAASFRAGTVPHLRSVRESFVDALTPEQLQQIDGITAVLRKHLGLDQQD